MADFQRTVFGVPPILTLYDSNTHQPHPSFTISRFGGLDLPQPTSLKALMSMSSHQRCRQSPSNVKPTSPAGRQKRFLHTLVVTFVTTASLRPLRRLPQYFGVAREQGGNPGPLRPEGGAANPVRSGAIACVSILHAEKTEETSFLSPSPLPLPPANSTKFATDKTPTIRSQLILSASM